MKLINSGAGIYIILNNISGGCYIGQSKNINNRWYTHRLQLLQNKHHCKHLQHSYNKYGKEIFVFDILETYELTNNFNIDKQILKELEQFWLDYMIFIRAHIYNDAKIASSPLGTKRTAEAKKKMSLAKLGISLQEAYKQKISVSHKGKIRSEKHCKNLSLAFMGHSVSEETRKKQSLAKIGKVPANKIKKEIEANIISRWNLGNITKIELATIFNLDRHTITDIFKRNNIKLACRNKKRDLQLS